MKFIDKIYSHVLNAQTCVASTFPNARAITIRKKYTSFVMARVTPVRGFGGVETIRRQ